MGLHEQTIVQSVV